MTPEQFAESPGVGEWRVKETLRAPRFEPTLLLAGSNLLTSSGPSRTRPITIPTSIFVIHSVTVRLTTHDVVH